MATIASNVANLVDENTRFSKTKVTEISPERSYKLDIGIIVGADIILEPKIVDGAGINNGSIVVLTMEDFASAGEKEVVRIRGEAPAAMQAWANTEGQTYRRYMPSSAGFLTAPKSIVCNLSCNSCHATGYCNCSTCKGSGETNCTKCSGTGACACSSCSGTTFVSCHTCNSGSLAMPSAYTGGGKHGCPSCGGSGKRSCINCNWNGKVMCHACRSGKVICSMCSGQGKYRCSACNGSTFVHKVLTFGWKSVPFERFEFPSGTPDHVKKVITHIGIDAIEQYVRRAARPHPVVVSDTQYYVEFKATFTWTETTLQVNGKQYVITGYGPDKRVFDYKNIVSDLLQADLETLYEGVNNKASGDQIYQNLRIFAQSEANFKILESAAKGNTSSNPELLQNGLLSADYVNKSIHAISASVGRLYKTGNVKPLAYTVLISAIISVIVLLLLAWLAEPNIGINILGVFIPVVVMWFFQTQLTHKNIAAVIAEDSPDIYHRMYRALSSSTIAKHWLIGGSAALLVATTLCGFSLNQIPAITQINATKQQNIAHLEQLNKWYHESDWTDFKYPDQAWLDVQIAQGNPRAVIVNTGRILGLTSAPVQQLELARTQLADLPESYKSRSDWMIMAALVNLRLTDNSPAAIKQLETAIEYSEQRHTGGKDNNHDRSITSDRYYGGPLNNARYEMAQLLKNTDFKKAVQYLNTAAMSTPSHQRGCKELLALIANKKVNPKDASSSITAMCR